MRARYLQPEHEARGFKKWASSYIGEPDSCALTTDISGERTSVTVLLRRDEVWGVFRLNAAFLVSPSESVCANRVELVQFNLREFLTSGGTCLVWEEINSLMSENESKVSKITKRQKREEMKTNRESLSLFKNIFWRFLSECREMSNDTPQPRGLPEEKVILTDLCAGM